MGLFRGWRVGARGGRTRRQFEGWPVAPDQNIWATRGTRSFQGALLIAQQHVTLLYLGGSTCQYGPSHRHRTPLPSRPPPPRRATSSGSSSWLSASTARWTYQGASGTSSSGSGGSLASSHARDAPKADPPSARFLLWWSISAATGVWSLSDVAHPRLPACASLLQTGQCVSGLARSVGRGTAQCCPLLLWHQALTLQCMCHIQRAGCAVQHV
jgi:hypothetical protein